MYNKKLFDEHFEAWMLGPTLRDIYDKYSMLYKYELKNNLLLKNVMKHHSVSNIKLNKKFFSEFENLSSDDDNNISDIPARCEANNSINFKKNEDINNNSSL